MENQKAVGVAVGADKLSDEELREIQRQAITAMEAYRGSVLVERRRARAQARQLDSVERETGVEANDDPLAVPVEAPVATPAGALVCELADIQALTDSQVLDLIRSDSLVNRIRRVLSAFAARAERQMSQQQPITPIQLRRQELETADAVLRMAYEAATGTKGGAG